MSIALRLFVVFLIAAAAFGQEPKDLRVTASERAVQMRVQVLYPGGTALYASDWKGGNSLDLSGLPIGSYELRIFSRDLDGTLSQKETTLQVSPDRITIDPPLPEDVKLTTTAHDGITGQIITTSGDLSFRFGDYLNHRDTEAMRLSPEGNLEVKGWIRAGQGILFSDGTVVDSKKKFKAKADASGTGTQNQIAKWIDSAGTLGDAAVSEVGGNVGIGTSTPGGKLHIFGAANSDIYAGLGVDMNAGPSLNFGYGGATFGRGAGFFNARPDPSATAPNPSLRFMTANAERMIITNAGNVGIGTSSPTEKLEINGNLALPLTSSASAGVITMGGNSVFHLFGTGDTFVGRFAGNFATTGNNNTGLGG